MKKILVICALGYATSTMVKRNIEEFLKERRKLDIIKGYTTRGIHRDDFQIFINNILKNLLQFPVE